MADADEVFKIDSLVSFRFLGDRVETQRPSDGALITFPTRYFQIVSLFVEWTSLAQAFLRACREYDWPPGDFVEFVTSLLEGEVLSRWKATEAEIAAQKTPWDGWGLARSFYFATRSRQDHPYATVAEMDRRLEENASLQRQPSSFKDYRGHPRLTLPEPFSGAADQPVSFVSTLFRRRSHRVFSPVPLSIDQLSTILFATWGATAERLNTIGVDVFLRKTSPSGGSLHVAEVYVLVLNVQSCPSGVYHYSVRDHELELLDAEDPQAWITPACGDQVWVADAAALFLSTAVLERSAFKYRFPRALRNIWLDIGHLSQTFCLTATSMNLAPFSIGALRDEVFETKLGLDFQREPVLFVNGVGRRIEGLATDYSRGRSPS